MTSAPFEIVCTSENRDDWLRARRSLIGASDVPTIMGLRGGLARLWAEKTGRHVEPLSGEWLDWGHTMEPVILAEYGRRSGRETRRDGILYRSTAYPFMGCTLDGWSILEDGSHRPTETKNVGEYNASKWRNGLPDDFNVQVQSQMIVMGCTSATIAACVGGRRLIWQDVDADVDLQGRITKACEHFWINHVLADTPPDDPDLGDVLSERPGMTLDLDISHVDMAREYAELKAQWRGLECQMKALKGRICATIGEAEYALFDDGSGFSFKTVNASGYYIEPKTYRKLTQLRPSKKRTRR